MELLPVGIAVGAKGAPRDDAFGHIPVEQVDRFAAHAVADQREGLVEAHLLPPALKRRNEPLHLQAAAAPPEPSLIGTATGGRSDPIRSRRQTDGRRN